MNDLKPQKISKNDLLKRLRETNQPHFEVIEPVTDGSLTRLLGFLRRHTAQNSYVSIITLPSR
jgi:hypothetical protein